MATFNAADARIGKANGSMRVLLWCKSLDVGRPKQAIEAERPLCADALGSWLSEPTSFKAVFTRPRTHSGRRKKYGDSSLNSHGASRLN
jgi:hypothetical protein